MIALISLVLAILASQTKCPLEAETAALRQRMIVFRAKVKGRAQLTDTGRWFFVQLYRWFPSPLEVLTTIRPKTVGALAWGLLWRCGHWKSRRRGGRPQVQTELNGDREPAVGRALHW